MKKRLTYEDVKHLDYYQDIGHICVAGERVDKPVGNRGYRYVNINGTSYPAHRVAWTCFYKLPPNLAAVDHIDGNPGNNHILNLRDVTLSQNSCNQAKHRQGLPPGVSKDRYRNQWRVCHKPDGYRWAHYGRYDTLAEALKVHRHLPTAVRSIWDYSPLEESS